jgi:uncharacterized membrane protein
MNLASISESPAATPAPPFPDARPRHERRVRRLEWLLLAVILVCGAALRFYNPGWDSGTLPHPDERSTVAFYVPSLRWPESLEQALDPRQSPLNPFWDVDGDHRRSYTYGHFPLYVLALSGAAVKSLVPLAVQIGLPDDVVRFMQEARSPVGFALIGRCLMALADTASIYLLYRLGRRLYGRWAGLLAAAFSAFTVLQIQLAHFFAVDPVSATFVFLALYGAVLMAERRTGGVALLTGVAVGLAVACKFSALPIAAAPLVAVVVAVRRPPAGAPAGWAGRQWSNLLITACAALVVFAITSPYVFLDFQNFWQVVVHEQGDMVSGVADFPFTRQYRGTMPYVYFLEQQVRWGMGPPLGVLALAGLAWVVWRVVRGRAGVGEYVVLSWLVLYFGPTGLFLAKFMRYMAPVTPLLVLLGAGLVAGRPNPEGDQPPRRFLPLRAIAGGLALVGAVVWSVAFVNGVYGHEHSWVTASRWVYQHVPDGACIAGEHWEEGFPQSWPEPGMSPGAHGYRQPLLPMYEEDTADKLAVIRDTLQACDYLVLASNRLWRTIPRLPERYPMSTRYYEALFGGELGFETIYIGESPPRLGPLVFDDQAADESFTVYDHPRPILFKKVRQLSDAEWEALLGDLWPQALPGYVGPPTLLAQLRGWQSPLRAAPTAQPPPRKSLLLDTPVDELPVVQDFRWNDLANRSTPAAIVIWWLALQVIGWFAWPLARRLFAGLADQGYLLAKSLGWLFIGYGVWLPASLRLLPNTLPTVGGLLAGLAVVGGWLAWRDRSQFRTLLAGRWRLILLGEAVFTLVYLFFAGLRVLNPDLWQPWNGGEKMLEIGFLNAIVKSAHMPPYDPYFAGGVINYYYYGLFLVGILIKLTGIQPAIAFNLAVPALAGLTAGSVFCLAYNLGRPHPAAMAGPHPPAPSGIEPHPPTPSPQSGEGANSPSPLAERGLGGEVSGRPGGEVRPVVVGLLAVLLVLLIGNLAGLEELLRTLYQAGGSRFASGLPVVGDAVRALAGLWRVAMEGARLPVYNFWDPTRVIPDTINEFPYFSYLFADLHPHMIGIPFTVLALALVYTWLVPGVGRRPLGTDRREHLSLARVGSASRRPSAQSPVTGRREQGEGWREMGVPPVTDRRERSADRRERDGERREQSADWREQDEERREQSADWREQDGEAVRPFALAARAGVTWAAAGRWLALAFALGALGAINTWDLPTYLGLAAFTFWLSRYRRTQAGQSLKRALGGVMLAALFGAATLVLAYLFYLPFFTNYQPLDVGLGLVSDRTDLGQFLLIWGLFIYVALSYLLTTVAFPHSRLKPVRALGQVVRRWSVAPRLVHLWRIMAPGGGARPVIGWPVWVAVGVVVMLWLLGYHVLGLLLPLILVALLLLLRREPGPGDTFTGVLLFTGLLILAGVEVFYLRDFLGGSSYYRMNTLFKFYIQVWVMLGIAAAVFLVQVWQSALRWRRAGRAVVWQALLTCLVAASLVYPLLGTRTRLTDRFDDPPPLGTLDGMAYMTTGTLVWPQDNPIELSYDHAAIRWLQENVAGTPVLAEAKIGYYREGGMRVSSYTGLPMPLGGLHQSEQRWPDQIGQRDGLYMEFWNTADPQRAWDLIRQLDISYVYIGQLERTLYDPELNRSLREWAVTYFEPSGYAKFETLEAQGRLEVVYENERTRIYRVTGGGQAAQ